MTPLRKGLIVASGIVAVAAAVLSASLSWAPGLFIPAIYAGVLFILLWLDRSRYKRVLEAPPGPDWRETGERFVDPETDRLVAVWIEPRSGKRAYVAARA